MPIIIYFFVRILHYIHLTHLLSFDTRLFHCSNSHLILLSWSVKFKYVSINTKSSTWLCYTQCNNNDHVYASKYLAHIRYLFWNFIEHNGISVSNIYQHKRYNRKVTHYIPTCINVYATCIILALMQYRTLLLLFLFSKN